MDDLIKRDRTISVAIAILFHVVLVTTFVLMQPGGRERAAVRGDSGNPPLAGLAPAAVVAHDDRPTECDYEHTRQGGAGSYELIAQRGPLEQACPLAFAGPMLAPDVTGALVMSVTAPIGDDGSEIRLQQSTGSIVSDSAIMKSVVASGLLSHARGTFTLTFARP